MTVAGVPAEELGVAPDPAWLREWNLDNLRTYWRGWVVEAAARIAERDPSGPLRSDGATWGLLGPGRLHRTVTSGDIISKTAAADYTAELFPRYADLLTRAKAYRLGDESITFTVSDGYAIGELANAVIDDVTGAR
jgi:hypothetical protein